MRGIMRVPMLLCLVGCALAALLGATAGQPETDPKVAGLIADLKNPQKNKAETAQALGDLKEKAAPAVPALVKLFEDKDEYVRLQAALALGKIGKPAVAPLTKAVGDTESGVRFYAVWALAFIGPEASSATPAVVKALKDKSADVRRKAAYALGRIDPDPDAVIEPLTAALADDNEDVRTTAAATLPKLGDAVTPSLVKLLKTDDSKVRNLVIKVIGEIGPGAKAALPELKTYFLQPKKESSTVAADALAGIGEPAIPVLMDGAKGEEAAVRNLAVQSLKKIGVPAVPHLIDLLGAKHTDVRRAVAAQLGFMQIQDKSVVIALGYALKDKDDQVRLNALNSLRNMGSSAKLAEKYVVELLTDADAQIRQNAFYTLQTLGVDPKPGLKKALSHKDLATRIKTATLMMDLNLEIDLAQPILVEGLKSEDGALKTQCAYALAKKGLKADEVLPIFLDGLKHSDATTRRQSAEAIALYGQTPVKDGKISAALIAVLDDPDDTVRAAALKTLPHFGGDAKVLLPALVKLLQHKDASLQKPATQLFAQTGVQAVQEVISLLKSDKNAAVHLACLQTLSMVGPPAKDAVGDLVKALGDDSDRARLLAARALGNIGPDAKEALPALKKSANDSNDNVKLIVKAALAQIMADKNAKVFQVQGVLTADDPMDPVRTSSHQVVHMYHMKAGQTYTIDLISTWDNFLRLENAQGKQLAQDDDSGGFPNARIVLNAPADGWYRIIVTSYTPGATGNYKLSVR